MEIASQHFLNPFWFKAQVLGPWDYEQQGDLKQAEALFTRAASSFGLKNTQFLLDVSRVREKQGDFKGALEAMEQYVSAMQKQGQVPSWSDDRLTALRQKVTAEPK